ncbi:DUF4386 domain-containing protein [Lysobacter koreensis]|uniref:DUF4386 domain-containing protein n=1 Tax=Lysobacter koreensis TaxID=266122 RepID=A0ABW2YLX8_9GAMM
MLPTDRIARTAGLLYLVVVITGLFGLMYVPSQITVRGDAVATLDNILRSESLFRLGIASMLINQIAFLLLPLVLYRLLRSVGQNAAVLMVALAVTSVPITLVALAHRLDALSLLGGSDYVAALSIAERNALVMTALKAYGNGILVTTVLWGLWLLPFGYLVFRSGFLPRLLGALLIVGGIGLTADVFGTVLSREFAHTSLSTILASSSSVGEIGICLWLLIVGVRGRAAVAEPSTLHHGTT